MILYHGTPLESGEKIIKEGKIQCQIQIQNGKMNKELEKEIETRWKWNKINE